MSINTIGIAGYKGCGKSLVADSLRQNQKFEILKFADPLKDMLRAIGLSDSHIEGDKKEIPLPLLCGKTARHAMQTLGTDWGRGMLGDDLWVNLWAERARVMHDFHDKVVADDVRFVNEIEAIHQLGGIVMYIRRGGFGSDGHASEDAGALEELCDFVFDNQGPALNLLADIDHKLFPDGQRSVA
jgi:hypothetical protein